MVQNDFYVKSSPRGGGLYVSIGIVPYDVPSFFATVINSAVAMNEGVKLRAPEITLRRIARRWVWVFRPAVSNCKTQVVKVVANVSEPLWKLGAGIGREHPLEEARQGKVHSEAKSHSKNNPSGGLEEHCHLTISSSYTIVCFRLKNSIFIIMKATTTTTFDETKYEVIGLIDSITTRSISDFRQAFAQLFGVFGGKSDLLNSKF